MTIRDKQQDFKLSQEFILDEEFEWARKNYKNKVNRNDAYIIP